MLWAVPFVTPAAVLVVQAAAHSARRAPGETQQEVLEGLESQRPDCQSREMPVLAVALILKTGPNRVLPVRPGDLVRKFIREVPLVGGVLQLSAKLEQSRDGYAIQVRYGWFQRRHSDLSIGERGRILGFTDRALQGHSRLIYQIAGEAGGELSRDVLSRNLHRSA